MNEKDYQPIHLLGNGVTKEFAYDWKTFDKTDLIVQLESVITGEITTPELGSDYDINIESMGGNVIFTTAPASDYYINISRQTSKYQSKGYSTSPGFQGSEIEKSFDIVSCCLQDMDYNIETFKSEFSAEINQNIEDYKTDTDEQIADFENEINSKLTQVDQAVQQLNRLDEILEECEDYAATSEEKAVIAQQSATSATNTLTEIIEEHQEALSDIILAKNTAKTEIQTLGIYKEGDKILYKDDEGNVHEFKNAAMSVGTLFWSFATADYVPEYALACDGTEYSNAMFTGLWNNYLTAETPKLLTKNYTQYQADIAEYGSCAAFGVEHSISAVHSGTTITEVAVTAATWEGKVTDVGEYVFSYDGTNWSLNSEVVALADYGVILTGEAGAGDTVTVTYAFGTHFKVPTIKDGTFVQQAMSNGELGKAYKAGLPNLTGKTGASSIGNRFPCDGVFAYRNDMGSHTYGTSGSGAGDVVYMDASKQNSIYGSSSTVQPNAVALRCFVVVANTSDNESAMDWSEWASSLAGKANKSDLSGEWVQAGLQLLSNSKVTSTPQVFDLSDYLPDNQHQYEIYVNLTIGDPSSNGIAINASPVNGIGLLFIREIDTAHHTITGNFIVFRGEQKIQCYTSSGEQNRISLGIGGYRKLGNTGG